MADILIRGMEMPENCTECPCFSQWDDCGINHEWKFADEFDKTKDRLPSCPLLPLPEGHGRLIDADAPIRVAYYDGTIHETTPSRLLCKHSLLDLPKTIVPAEGGDADGN